MRQCVPLYCYTNSALWNLLSCYFKFLLMFMKFTYNIYIRNIKVIVLRTLPSPWSSSFFPIIPPEKEGKIKNTRYDPFPFDIAVKTNVFPHRSLQWEACLNPLKNKAFQYKNISSHLKFVFRINKDILHLFLMFIWNTYHDYIVFITSILKVARWLQHSESIFFNA